MARRNRVAVALVLLSVTALLCGCSKERMCHVPVGDATCQIEPDSPLYPGLNSTSGYEYLYGGYQGIVVIRTGWRDFVAYERTCPHDKGVLRMAPDYGNMVLECPDCGSRFSTFAEGTPVEGSVTSCSLYKYATYFDGRILYISNYETF